MKTVVPLFETLEIKNQSPSEIYAFYLEQLKANNSPWPKSYMSCALTNGGYGRTSMQFWDAFTANANLARRVIDALNNNELIGENDLMFFPGDTKSPEESWKQLDYSIFFCLFIVGIESRDEAKAIEDYIRANVNPEGFINRKLSFTERQKSYRQLVDLFEQYVKEHDLRVNPVESIIELLDTDLSLGSWMESDVARRFGAKIFRVQINESIPTQDEALNDVIAQIKQIREADHTFNFFSSRQTENKPIYLAEA